MRKPDWKHWLDNKEDCHYWLSSYLTKKVLRKSRDLSLFHLRKAEHNFRLAQWLEEKHGSEVIFKEEQYYDWVITIYYYAVYHAAQALMSKEGLESKSHAATLCFLLYHHYHREKKFEPEEIALLAFSLERNEIEYVGMSKELREKASYDIHAIFEQKVAKQVKEQTAQFITKIRLQLL